MNQKVCALSRVGKMYQHNKKHHQSDTSVVSLRRKKKVVESRLSSGSSRAKLDLAGKVKKPLLVIPDRTGNLS